MGNERWISSSAGQPNASAGHVRASSETRGESTLTPIPLTPETEAVTRRILWFESPERALTDPVRFLAYAMARAAHEDMKVIRRCVDDVDLREALENAPPGIINPR